MKFKTTRNEILRNYENVKMCGYYDLQFLLRNHEPIAYTSGIYGWNYDVYNVYGLTICTGYRSMPGERLEHIGEYEEKADAVCRDYNNYKGAGGYERQCEEIEKLLKEFCAKNGGRI